jgi:Holliday junction DNA helicase RuvA
MITGVNGTVVRVGTDWVDVDLGAVSVRVNITTSTVDRVGAPGDPVRLFTSLQVREDSLTLYGFPSEDSKRSFESLIGINGVGPKLALSVLSMFSPEDLAAAVAAEDVVGFSRVPGVGKKTAGRIVLELKGQLSPEWEISGQSIGAAEVLEALTALGYSLIEAREAVASLTPDSGTTTEERVRAALDRLAGN